MARRLGLMSLLVVGVVVGSAFGEDDAALKGKILFKGDKEKYKRTTIDTTKDPNCKKSKDKIGSYEVILNKSEPTTIRNVMVFVKEGLGDRKYPAPTEPVVLDQHGCEYMPHVFGVMVGQPLRVRNSDDTNHNIHFLPKVNTEHNFSQPKKDMEKDLTLNKEEPFKIKCDVHPWMGAHMAVFEHPFFSVTGDEGAFELKGLPPGKYVIEAWHEKFGSQTATVEIKSGESKQQDFTFEPDKK